LLPPHTPSASSVAATAVVVLRHGAFPIALGNEMWQKYKIGEAFKIVDPETKEDGIWAGPPPPGKAAATPDREECMAGSLRRRPNPARLRRR
jgi:hypothetical protein